MCMYRSLAGHGKNFLKKYHHVKLEWDTILDLEVWKMFLENPVAYCRPFMDFENCVELTTLEWCTDVAKALGKGFGGHFVSHWFVGQWSKELLTRDPSIEFLELYTVAVSVLLWINMMRNKRIQIFCDNQSVVHMINSQSSRHPYCMRLIRIITLECLIHNVRLYGKHLRTHLNGRADVLSRNKVDKFKQLSESMGQQIDQEPMVIPLILRDIEKLWN